MPALDLSKARTQRCQHLGVFVVLIISTLLWIAPQSAAGDMAQADIEADIEAEADSQAASGEPLTDLEELGRRVYVEGLGSSEIVAVLSGTVEIPATALTCVGCHGSRGEGRPEGGVSPTDLRRHMLTRPYERTSASGRVHGPYDDRALVKAIAMGVDPAGNELQAAMPRYRMSSGDMKALVAYLARLGSEAEPGVADDRLRIGVLVARAASPTDADAERPARVMASVIGAYLEDLNAAGGIFGRELERVEVVMDVDTVFQPEAIDDVLRDADIVALAGGDFSSQDFFLHEEAGDGALWLDAAHRLGIPWIGPRTLDPRLDFPLAREIFYLEPGLAQQSATLAEHAARQWPGRRARVVVATDEPLLAAAADAIAARLKTLEEPEPERVEVAADGSIAVPAQSAEGPVFLLLPGSLGQRALDALGPTPVLAPSALAATWYPNGAPTSAQGQARGTLHVTVPVTPTGRDARALETWAALAERHQLPPTASSSTIAALVAVRVLGEGLRRAGREVTREGLISALQSLIEFETGLLPPITFGANRRVGIDGDRVVILER